MNDFERHSLRPRQNRVTPTGAIIAAEARGTLMGNRGCLHDKNQQIRRYHVGRRWILCVLEFKGRRRQIMSPNRYTELFFLDEATGFAAGHRPCAECQRGRYRMFQQYWAAANRHLTGDKPPSAETIDAILHGERIGANRTKRTYRERIAALPDGTLIERDDRQPYLIWKGALLLWEPGGYGVSPPMHGNEMVTVLTPPCLVQVLTAGYPVGAHPSAARNPG